MDTRILTPTEHNGIPFFHLLQISDPLFPIGGFTQSYGLETYVQKGIVHDSDSSKRYLESYLLNSFLYNDLLTVRLAWEYTGNGQMEKVLELDEFFSASKAPRELRTASVKLGKRFLKILEIELGGNKVFDVMLERVNKGNIQGCYPVMYGFVTRLLSIGKAEALSAVSYGAAAAIINNCAKLVPISQNDGQRILFGTHGIFQKLLEKVEGLSEEHLGSCCFGFDLRSMQHERLYTRIYIS
ncbi:urease accessory protein UreF [Pseudobacteroides cellulosolvens]|uniref:Urease accessory protein UreF n=1 Tax=Pseudobacteroides cellulosolvens ATCC 35603 = DSM 2933 TaxID=398512 RepID=A0A0L6JW09_9FIRM|nr:urease accessory protein UreF [Pseudobacteroides cellulosolvens]KNY29795.1 Urease accessory protein ureF [Pseudobacteroides cellulosolvens ATCC 35603 = DSM 2933]